MFFQKIPIEEIDINDETFRISETLDSARVQDSLREIGQVNPVLLFAKVPTMLIVCGFRRVRAMRSIGTPLVLARVLSKTNYTPAQAFELALRDNLSHRELEPLEKARILFKLRNRWGVTADTLIKTYLPLLGLLSHMRVLQAYISLNNIQPAMRQCLIEGRLTLSSVEYLSQMPVEVQERIASLMRRIRLSASLQKKVLGLLEDLSSAAGARLDTPLDNPEIEAVLNDSVLSYVQKGERLHDLLYRAVYPSVSKAMERFCAGQKRLGLPASIRIVPHPYFETQDLRVEFQASTPEQFRELAGRLMKAAESSELEDLFSIV